MVGQTEEFTLKVVAPAGTITKLFRSRYYNEILDLRQMMVTEFTPDDNGSTYTVQVAEVYEHSSELAKSLTR